MTIENPPSRRRERADSIRNRAAIMEAAAIEFSRRGKAADVREIAQQAGVAMGTLYRHFPTKEDLLDTILHEVSLAWEVDALQKSNAETDPWRALDEFITDTVLGHAEHVALRERLARPLSERQFDECAERVVSVADAIVARCHKARLLRKGVTGEDIVQLVICLSSIARPSADDGLVGSGIEHKVTAVRATQRVFSPWMRQQEIAMDGLRPVHGPLRNAVKNE